MQVYDNAAQAYADLAKQLQEHSRYFGLSSKGGLALFQILTSEPKVGSFGLGDVTL